MIMEPAYIILLTLRMEANFCVRYTQNQERYKRFKQEAITNIKLPNFNNLDVPTWKAVWSILT